MIEKDFLAHLLKSETHLGKIVSSGFKSSYLDFETVDFSAIRALYDVITVFYLRYRRIPDRTHLPNFLSTEKYTDDEVKAILLLFEEINEISPAQDFDFLTDMIKKDYPQTVVIRLRCRSYSADIVPPLPFVRMEAFRL